MAGRTKRFSEFEVRRITATLRERGDVRDLAMFVAGINTGYRISELLWWDIQDVRWNDEWRDSVTVPAEQIKHAKQPRSIRLNEAVTDTLGLYFEARGGLEPDDPVFLSQKGGRLSRSAAYRAIKSACRKAGLPSDNRGTHSLRKTFGWAVYQAQGIRTAQKALGHSQVTTTEDYLGVDEAEVDAVVQGLNLAR